VCTKGGTKKHRPASPNGKFVRFADFSSQTRHRFVFYKDKTVDSNKVLGFWLRQNQVSTPSNFYLLGLMGGIKN